MFSDEKGARNVLPAFSELLFETFSAHELRDGTFKAIGQVHAIEKNKHFPGQVAHYWPSYDPRLSRAEPTLMRFVQYAFAAAFSVQKRGETFAGIEKLAEAFAQLATLAPETDFTAPTRRRHRSLLSSLRAKPGILAQYHAIQDELVISRKILSLSDWQVLCPSVRAVAETLAGTALDGSAVEDFLKWDDAPATAGVEPGNPARENLQAFESGEKSVNISMGSIHSVKGETHTATLVLETFWHDPNLGSLVPWLAGDMVGENKTGKRNIARLKLHYVAMTRPSHLLCLAVHRPSFFSPQYGNAKDLEERLRQRGWSIKDV